MVSGANRGNMIVRDLIASLDKLPQDAVVEFHTDEYTHDVENVEHDEDDNTVVLS